MATKNRRAKSPTHSKTSRAEIIRTAKPRSKVKRKKGSPKVARALRLMRSGASLRKAAKKSNVSPKTVIRNAGSALMKTKGGRYKPKKTDRLVRMLMIPTPQGPQEISVRGLQQASLLASYWSSLHKYYETGETAALRKFDGKFIAAVGGKKYPLITDTEILDRLGSAGVVSFESLYARS